ncbi:MAG: phosphatase PAP2 family protein [Rhodobacteraceae bacterium]|nr:phosphatase PAP2 family protein [Paracoccaceae bacterium]
MLTPEMTQLFNAIIGLLSAHPSLALFIVFVVAMGEALLIVGLFVPSTTVLVGAGTLIGVGELPFWPIFLATVAGCVAGDALSYWVGWRYNERIRQVWPFSKYPLVLTQGEAFFHRYGAMSIFIVRFIPGAKAVVPAIAAMAGMPAFKFTLINIASAFVWSGVHILPAIALGRGIRVAHLADPRLMVLLALVAVVLVLAWFATRLAYFIVLPRLDRGRHVLVARLASNPAQWARLSVRVLENRDGLFVTFVLGLLALLALRVFVYVIAALLLAPGLLRSDQAISAFAQNLRDETVTHWMSAITMLGDGRVLVPILVMLIGLFAARRQWGVVGIVIAAAIASAGFEPMLTALLFRLPPGHGPLDTSGGQMTAIGNVAHATVVYGLLSLFLARAVPRSYRVAVYLATVLLIALIAVSRIYLLAHWPSDVLAGVTFGAALVLITAFLLHGRGVQVPRRGLAALVAITALGVIPTHLILGYPRAQQAYAIATPVVELARADWLAGGWHDQAPARILLDGDYGEPMILQSDRPLSDLVQPLVKAGWTLSTASQLDSLLGAILPTTEGLAPHSPWPLTHVGRTPVATLLQPVPGAPASRYALRLWDSGVVITDGTKRHPLLLASVAGEKLDPVTLGWSLLEPLDLDDAQTAAIRAAVAQALDVPDPGQGPLLAPR